MRWFRKRGRETDLERELQAHLELEAEELQSGGLSESDAFAAARVRLGNPTQLKEDVRAAWGWCLWDRMVQDARHAARLLLRQPGFSVAAVLSLSLGIGVTTALFLVLNVVVLRPLPYREPEQLVWLTQVLRGSSTDELTITADFLDWRRLSRSFTALAGYNHQIRNLSGVEPPIQVRTVRASAPLLEILGVRPAMGRDFSVEEDRAGHDGVAILTDEFWTRQFGRDAGVVGRTLRIDDRVFRVIGVLPKAFVFPGAQPVDLLTPLGKDESRELQRQEYATVIFDIVGRLRSGVTVAQARDELAAIQAHLPVTLPSKPQISIQMLPLHERLFGKTATASCLLLGAALVLLIIACANVSNLLSVRLAQREREIAMRVALGGSRGRLLAQLLVESSMLGLIGCSAGVLLAGWLRRPLLTLVPFPLPGLGDLPFDWRVMLFAVSAGLASTLLFGGLPALRVSSPAIALAMKNGGSGSIGGAGTLRTLSAIAMAEIALTLVLTAGAALVVQSFWKMRFADLGFSPAGLNVATLHLTGAGYRAAPQRIAFIDALLERVRALPSVEDAAITTAWEIPPGRGRATNVFQIEGRVKEVDSRERPVARFQQVSTGLFSLMKIPLVRGQFPTEQDPGVVVNHALADKYFPGEDAIGHRILWGGPEDWRTIIGVTGDVKTSGLAAAPEPTIYYSYRRAAGVTADIGLILRPRGDGRALASELRSVIAATDPNQPLATYEIFSDRLSDSIAAPRFAAAMLAAFAGLALLLGMIGVYGVMACRVRWQRREMALRQALGASPHHVEAAVIWAGLKVIVPGSVLGLGAAVASGRLLGSLLYGVEANDPLTLASVWLLLAGAGLAAVWIPARRAGKLDAAILLRQDN